LPQVSFLADFRHGDHPDLKGRKQFIGKSLAVLHLVLKDRQSALKQLGQAVLQKAQLDADLNEEALDIYLRNLLGEAKLYANRNALPGHETIIATFRSCARKVSCGACAGKDICNGHDLEDPRIVARGALCLEPLTSTFANLVALAARLYAMALHCPGHLELRLKTTRAEATASLGGRTFFPDDDDAGQRKAVVEISLPLEELNASHIVRLPYVMFHEVFVHGPESWTAAGRRVETSETCEFREGFVDAAAAHLLSVALTRRDVTLFDDESLRLLLAEATQAAHKERTTPGYGNTSLRAASELKTLRQNGAILFGAIERMNLGGHAALLAAIINSWPSSPRQRGAFLAHLDRILPGLPLSADTPRATQRLFSHLGGVLKGGEAVDHQLVRKCLSISADLDESDF